MYMCYHIYIYLIKLYTWTLVLSRLCISPVNICLMQKNSFFFFLLIQIISEADK